MDVHFIKVLGPTFSASEKHSLSKCYDFLREELHLEFSTAWINVIKTCVFSFAEYFK